MDNSAPLEIIAGPIEVWLGPVGEAFPDIGEVPAGNWVKVGTNGDKNITEDGVSVSHPQTLEVFRSLGSTGPVKAFRTEEDLIISFTLADLTLEQYKFVLNGGAVTDVPAAAGVGGYRKLPLLRGLDVTQYAMLARGLSPYMATGKADYQVPRVVHQGEPEAVFVKGTPAGLLFEMRAIEDPDFAGGRFGQVLAQDAAAA